MQIVTHTEVIQTLRPCKNIKALFLCKAVVGTLEVASLVLLVGMMAPAFEEPLVDTESIGKPKSDGPTTLVD